MTLIVSVVHEGQLWLNSWNSGLSYILGSGLSKSPLSLLGSLFFVCGLLFYLGVESGKPAADVGVTWRWCEFEPMRENKDPRQADKTVQWAREDPTTVR